MKMKLLLIIFPLLLIYSFYSISKPSAPPLKGVVVSCSTGNKIYFRMQPILLKILVENKTKNSVDISFWELNKQPTSIIVKDEKGDVLPLTNKGREYLKYAKSRYDFRDRSHENIWPTGIKSGAPYTASLWLNEFVDFTSLNSGSSDRKKFKVEIVFLGHPASLGTFEILNQEYDVNDLAVRNAVLSGEFNGETMGPRPNPITR